MPRHLTALIAATAMLDPLGHAGGQAPAWALTGEWWGLRPALGGWAYTGRFDGLICVFTPARTPRAPTRWGRQFD